MGRASATAAGILMAVWCGSEVRHRNACGVHPWNRCATTSRAGALRLDVGTGRRRLAAGHSRFASDLKSGAAETVFVHYGDLFSVPGAQGTADDLTEDEGRLLAEFMTDIIDEQLEDAEGDDARVLRNARAELVPNGPEQGLLQPVAARSTRPPRCSAFPA